MSDEVVTNRESFRGVVTRHRELCHHSQQRPFQRGELLVFERQRAGGRVIESSDAGLEARHIVLGPPLSELVALLVEQLDQLPHLRVVADGGGGGPDLGEFLSVAPSRHDHSQASSGAQLVHGGSSDTV